MVGRGMLKELFLKNMEPDAKKLINKAPYNLENGIKPKAGPVFLDKSWADCEFQYIRGKKTMNATDSNKYNILFIGPTGSGKSHLINCLFNSTVAQSTSSVCEKFNLSFNRSWNRTIEGQKKATIPNMAVGFYPGVKFEDIIDDYKNLCFATIF